MIRRIVSGVLVLSSFVGTSAPAQSVSFSERPITHEVRLSGTRFTPSEVRAAPGDTIRFVNGLGGPHNLQFMAESLTVAARNALNDAMPNKILPLTSPMFLTEGETYTFVVPRLASGRYPFLCSPHWATMRGALIISE